MSTALLKSGYKHQVQAEVRIHLPVSITRWIDISKPTPPFLRIDGDVLVIGPGYCFDGASGGMIDSDAALAGALGHDAMYQCLRWEVLPLAARQPIDDFAYEVWVAAGMWRIRAWNAWWWLKVGGEAAALVESIKPVRRIVIDTSRMA
jgi:hypothetical protein